MKTTKFYISLLYPTNIFVVLSFSNDEVSSVFLKKFHDRSRELFDPAEVRHPQRMKSGVIVGARCFDCKAGLGESCSHVACVLYYLESGKWKILMYANEMLMDSTQFC